jgi:transcriptional regulator of acetoin/glycerol metabolism
MIQIIVDGLVEALEDNDWKQELAAKQLGVARSTVQRLMARHGVPAGPPGRRPKR